MAMANIEVRVTFHDVSKPAWDLQEEMSNMKDRQTYFRSRSLDDLDDVTYDETPTYDPGRRKSVCVARLHEEISSGSKHPDTMHSTQAGSLCFYSHKKRQCFIEPSFVKQALEDMVIAHYGDETWDEVRAENVNRRNSGIIPCSTSDEHLTATLVNDIAKVVGLSTGEIWEMFGERFFEFCEEAGYDKIMQVLGGTLVEFLQNLDAMHDHLATIYPGMRAPSFRCMESTSGDIDLSYHSERPGLEHIVVGLVKSVAKELNGKDVDVTIRDSDEIGKDVQFSIKHISGMNDGESDSAMSDDSDSDGLISYEPLISPMSFCKIFPFHVMFDRNLVITQVGDCISKLAPKCLDSNSRLHDIFRLNQPQIHIDFDQICHHSNIVFVLSFRQDLAPTSRLSSKSRRKQNLASSTENLLENEFSWDRSKMRLKGQMVYISESDQVMFICSPYVSNLDDLHDNGLFLSDIPVHDATRDLVLLSEQFRAEYELTQRLEVMTQNLRHTYKELEIEKQLTDKLIYSILPHSVANSLRAGKPVQALKYNLVTILFSGLCDFDRICTHNVPLAVVKLLNHLYTKFDMLLDRSSNDVYKVETAGDKYLVASGLPEKNVRHAKHIALLSLQIMDIAKDVKINGETVMLCIGIHSGDVVAGVIGQKLPRFCVFGDTVNIASRMETTSQPNKINVSEATYRCLQSPECHDQQFIFKERGPMNIKGKNVPIVTYFLSRRSRPGLQALLKNGLAVRESPKIPLELLQRRRKSETFFRFETSNRSARRCSELVLPSHGHCLLLVPRPVSEEDDYSDDETAS
ncbi:guanylate cyclase soluble subunit beta-1-like [Lineus longissimus]|uniref:guanylate cyclase soluble subunit beta-1-like n=1 Tax=Lineus longissimus TaxID=88925 RepID=UPI002B4D8AED